VQKLTSAEVDQRSAVTQDAIVEAAGAARIESLLQMARAAKGFMPDDEGAALFDACRDAVARAVGSGTAVEIGAWCGKSTIYLGAACEVSGAVLFSIDHHHGSEENQAGWEHHDPSVIDSSTGKIDTLPLWRANIDSAGLAKTVVGMVGDSPTIAAHWGREVDFCFIDGGHGEEPAWADFLGWYPQISLGGTLAIHDVFPDPADGGRPPYEIWCAALDTGQFEQQSETGSLRTLVRKSVTPGQL
jgi:predicted O-methyltransferase YrrM